MTNPSPLVLVAQSVLSSSVDPPREWQEIGWCSAGIRLEVPTSSRELTVSLQEREGRVQNYRVEDLRQLSDGLYELREGDFFLELEIHKPTVDHVFPAASCGALPRPVPGSEAASWCPAAPDTAGEGSITHIAEFRLPSGILELRLDASALPTGAPERILRSVKRIPAERCRDGG